MSRPNTESVLVIILAETRAYELTYDSFEINMMRPLGADLCLCVANNEREDPGNPFYRNAKYVWAYDEPEDWGDGFDVIQRQRGLQANWRQLLQIKDQWLGGVLGEGQHPGSAGILLFFRLFLKECILQNDILGQYDRFVITRSDLMHRVPHVPLRLLDPKYVWIPDEEKAGGYTDRHIVLSRGDVLDALSIADPIIEAPNQLYALMKHHQAWNLEQFIRFSFKRCGLKKRVRYFPYTMYAVRAQGGHTRWQEGIYDEDLGYYIKYRSEYESYLCAKTALAGAKGWSYFRLKLFNLLKYIRKKRNS